MESEDKNMEGKSGKVELPAYGLAEDVLQQNSEAEGDGPLVSSHGEELADGRAMKLVTFMLDKEEYALGISEVQEIDRVADITRVPNSPDHVIGVINLRGKVLPVIDLKKRLHLGEARITKESRIVVVESGPKVLGLMVDSVAQVLNLNADQIESTPEEVVKVHENFTRGVGKMDERMVILLDLEKVVEKGPAI